MSTRLRITLAVAVVAVVVLAGLPVLFIREPVHEGRRLTAWLRDLETGPGGVADKSDRAGKAVKHIGTNAIPHLLEMLRAEDPDWKVTAVEWLREKCDLDFTSSLAREQRRWAVMGFKALGREASAAVPALRSIVAEPQAEIAAGALEAMCGIGGPQVEATLLEALRSTNLLVHLEALSSLASFRSRGAEAVPALLRDLESNESLIRQQAARALGEIGLNPRAVVPALRRCLTDGVGGVKAAAALALGSFGTNAIEALPALRALAEEQNEETRRFARLAVWRVQCEVRSGAIVRGPKDRKRIALAFTGHQYGEGGETILNELARHGGRASFFLTGTFLTNSQYRALVSRMQKEAHYLGPHSDHHLLYCAWEDSRKTLISETEFQEDLLANVARLPSNPNENRRFARYFLPPFEHYNREIADWTRAQGWTLINFTPGTRSNADYTGEADQNFVSSQKIFDSIIAREGDDPDGLSGFILLLHLGAGPGRADKFHVRFGELLGDLAGRGYEFVRVDELLRPPRDPNFSGSFRGGSRTNR